MYSVLNSQRGAVLAAVVTNNDVIIVSVGYN